VLRDGDCLPVVLMNEMRLFGSSNFIHTIQVVRRYRSLLINHAELYLKETFSSHLMVIFNFLISCHYYKTSISFEQLRLLDIYRIEEPSSWG
jgi:hypothetical protein